MFELLVIQSREHRCGVVLVADKMNSVEESVPGLPELRVMLLSDQVESL
jgi:hypothetical protein